MWDGGQLGTSAGSVRYSCKMADLETKVLHALNEQGSIADSGVFAESLAVDHQALVGVIKSLQASELITVEVGLLQLRPCKAWVHAPVQGPP